MPLYKSIEVNSQTNVKIWHIKESIDQLKSKTELKDENLNRLSSMKSDIRKKEFLSVKHNLFVVMLYFCIPKQNP